MNLMMTNYLLFNYKEILEERYREACDLCYKKESKSDLHAIEELELKKYVHDEIQKIVIPWSSMSSKKKEDICYDDIENIVEESICEDIQIVFEETSAIKCLCS